MCISGDTAWSKGNRYIFGTIYFLDLSQEFASTFPKDEIPDLLKEGEFIRTFNSIDELFRFQHFDSSGRASIENIQILIDEDQFIVKEDNEEIARVSRYVQLPVNYLQRNVMQLRKNQKPFDPPVFGVTILGSGHGFDPSHRTSGFVLWVNKRGSKIYLGD